MQRGYVPVPIGVVFSLSCIVGLWGCPPMSASSPIAASSTLAPGISAQDAKNHIGEQETVCGKVASENAATNSKGSPTFINLDSAYPNQVFTILVWEDDRKNVGELPHEGERVCATGVIRNYKGSPEIMVKSKAQLRR
jgi:DNA/RNA endonuclease YhcR with UshA esterase domain